MQLQHFSRQFERKRKINNHHALVTIVLAQFLSCRALMISDICYVIDLGIALITNFIGSQKESNSALIKNIGVQQNLHPKRKELLKNDIGPHSQVFLKLIRTFS